MDERSINKKNELFNENEQQDHNDEQIDTIQLDDDRQRPQSASLIKTKKSSKIPQTPIGPPPSSHKQKHRIESIQFNDDNHTDINENEDEQQKSTEDGNNKARKIRQLQNKLSRQEEETKKKFDELQSKQSRLENALKLLVKQTTTYKKRREQTTGNVEGKFHLFILTILKPKNKKKRFRCTCC